MDPAEGRRCGWCEKTIFYGLFCLYDDCADKHYEQWKKLATDDKGEIHPYQGHVPNKKEMETSK